MIWASCKVGIVFNQWEIILNTFLTGCWVQDLIKTRTVFELQRLQTLAAQAANVSTTIYQICPHTIPFHANMIKIINNVREQNATCENISIWRWCVHLGKRQKETEKKLYQWKLIIKKYGLSISMDKTVTMMILRNLHTKSE